MVRWIIVRTDNFARETVAEGLVATFENEVEAKICLEALQASVKEHDPDWYKMEDEGYRLWRGMAERVE